MLCVCNCMAVTLDAHIHVQVYSSANVRASWIANKELLVTSNSFFKLWAIYIHLPMVHT
jgi:hypothetical protein